AGADHEVAAWGARRVARVGPHVHGSATCGERPCLLAQLLAADEDAALAHRASPRLVLGDARRHELGASVEERALEEEEDELGAWIGGGGRCGTPAQPEARRDEEGRRREGPARHAQPPPP